jgi:membrane-associated protease RseP (regulator of RpoE activity)
VGVLLFILALLIVIMIHEAGHFTAAKTLGFKAPKFFVGFGPTLWSTKRGETEYGIKAIPAGGFVKILGMNPYEEVPPQDEPRAYYNKPRWQRAIVILAGPLTHFPLALILLTILYMTAGYNGVATNSVGEVQTTIGSSESPAAVAGLEAGDTIVAVDGVRTQDWDEVRSFIQKHPNDTVEFVVRRGDSERTVEVELGTALIQTSGAPVDFAPPGEELDIPEGSGLQRVGFLGVSPEVQTENGFFGSVGAASSEVVALTQRSFEDMTGFFGGLFNGEFFDQIEETGRPQGTGIVGAGRVVAETAGEGRWEEFLYYTAALTIFIGIINLLPLVPLDGGHLMVIAWESITRKQVDMRKLIPLAAAVLAFFVILSVVFLYYDIVSPLETGL